MFKSEAVKHAAQFTKMLDKIANYVQKKYNNDIAKKIKDVECPIFKFSICSVLKISTNPDGTTTQEKIDEMDIYMWKKDYKLVEKEKRVFPSILDQCSPSPRSQLEGAETFEATQEKNDIIELLELIRGFSCKHDQNNDKFYAVFNSLQALFINFQKNDQTNDEYLKKFQA